MEREKEGKQRKEGKRERERDKGKKGGREGEREEGRNVVQRKLGTRKEKGRRGAKKEEGRREDLPRVANSRARPWSVSGVWFTISTSSTMSYWLTFTYASA